MRCHVYVPDVVDLPEPTQHEARALILGSGGFWAGWGLSVPFFTNGSPLSLAAFFIAFACGIWLYLGGIFHLWARAQGRSVRDWYFGVLGKAPWNASRDGYGWGWMRLILPSSYRRAARVLGWNESVVLAALWSLLAADLVAAVFLFSHAPAPA
jgi:hypothetical protein